MLRESDPAVLITGATGFIGRHVVGRLLLAGRRMVIFARRRAGVARMLSPYRDYLKQDVQCDDSAARRLLARHRVEAPVIDHRELERFLELAWCSEQKGPLPAAHGSATPAI